MKPKVIAVTNSKGGTGKTTLAINLGCALASKGKRILLVDLDSQANLTYSLGITPERTIVDVLQDAVPLESILQVREGVSTAPASRDLAGLELALVGEIGRENILRRRLAGVQGYDYILIDCPPSLSILTVNALTAASGVLIPLQAEVLALQGLSQLLDSIRRVRQETNPRLKVRGIIASLFDGRRKLSGEVLAEIQNQTRLPVFNTRIRVCVKLAEAPSFGKSIFAYAPKSNGAIDYMDLATEFLKGEGKHGPRRQETEV